MNRNAENVERVYTRTHTGNLKEKQKKNIKGITIVALVITIIILLILPGISIYFLNGNNGLFSKTKQAREKYSISEAKERLTTKLMQLQTEVTSEEQRSATIEDINKLVDENSKYYDKEIESVKDRNENKLVKISGYYFEVDSKLNIVGNIDASELTVTETTYKVNSTNGNIMNVTVNIKNEIGIQKVIKPDNTDVTPAGSKEQVAIDYDVEDGKEYKFKVQLIGSNEQKEYTLKANLNAKPEIKQNESNAYPILTEYGVEINKIVEIDYGENTNNYYSLDNGNSWIKYTEDGIKMEKEGTILAKSVIDGEIAKEAKENITMQLADDALGLEAYDKDEETAFKINKSDFKEYKINIDTNVNLKKIEIYANVPKMTWSSTADIKFYSHNNKPLDKQTIPKEKNKVQFDVPEGTEFISICNNDHYTEVYIYDIKTDLGAPEISYEAPKITKDGVKKGQVSIKTNKQASKTFYKLNNDEWKEYNNDIINIEKGDIVYARGLYGNIYSIENKYECTENVIENVVFDGDYETYMPVHTYTGTRYMSIDKSAWNKKINIKWWNWKYDGYYSSISIENDKGDAIKEYTLPSGTMLNEEYEIPEGASKLKYYVKVAGDNYWSPDGFGKLYEIEVK